MTPSRLTIILILLALALGIWRAVTFVQDRLSLESSQSQASPEDLLYHPKPSDFGMKEGDIIGARSSGDPDIFIINDYGYKRLFLNPIIFSFYGHLRYDGVKLVSRSVRDAFLTSVLFRNCETDSQEVYALEVTGDDTGALHHVNLSGPEAQAQDKRFFQKIFCMNSKEENLYPKSPISYTSLDQIPGYWGNLTPTPSIISKSLTISGRVFNQQTGEGFSNIAIQICTAPTTTAVVTTDDDGFFTYPSTTGQSFCVRMASNQLQEYDGPYLMYGSGRAWAKSYESQVAGIDCVRTPGCATPQKAWDLRTDTNFNFIYVPRGATFSPPPEETPPAETVTPTTTTTANPVSSPGPLRVLQSNPRYFTSDGVSAVMLGGYYSGYEFAKNMFEGGVRVSFDAYVNFLAQNNLNHIRLWLGESSANDKSTMKVDPVPFQRSGTCCAGDGGNKFDLDKFNQAYFDQLRSYISKAEQKNIYVSIMLFNGWDVWDRQWQGVTLNPMRRHPYARENNVNGVNGDSNGDGSGEEMHSLGNPAALNRQKAFIRRLIDTVNEFDNVLYEISNEDDVSAKAWQYEMIKFIHQYEGSKPKQHPVGMSELQGGTSQDLFNSVADYVSPNAPGSYNKTSNPYVTNPAAADGKKVILVDTDHIGWSIFQNADTARGWAWKSFTRGYNVTMIGDIDQTTRNGGAYGNDGFAAGSKAIGHTVAYSRVINLSVMKPSTSACSTKYCLVSDNEYLVYAPSGGSFTVNLAAGTFAVEWFNPRTGQKSSGGAKTGGSPQSFQSPGSGDWVLYLKRQ